MKSTALIVASLVLIPMSLLADIAPAEELQLTLPPVVFAVPGVPVSIYYDNVVLTQTPEQYRFEVKCQVGRNELRRWTVTPSNDDAGEHPLEVIVSDSAGKVLQREHTTLRIAPADAGATSSLRLLIVGDSLTHATLYPNEIARLLSTPDNPQWTMLGTHKPKSAAVGVAHEGYGGWKWSDFLTRYSSDTPSPTGRKTTSPFVFPSPDGKAGEFDLARYFRQECDNRPPDVVLFLLGINDCFAADPNDPDARITEVLNHADKLLAEFRKAAPRAILAVGLTTPPNSRQEAFEANYQDRYTRWGWKRIQHRLVQRMLDQFAGREKERIHLVPTELNLDPIDGYPINNGVHPNATGYAQIGASFYAWLKTTLASAGTLQGSPRTSAKP